MNSVRAAVASLVVFAAAASLGPSVLAQSPEDGDPREFMTDRGKGRVFVPESTSRGDWSGTWMYKSRDFYIALWLRPGEDGLDAKLQYMGVTSAEAFETDWSGNAEYYVAGEKAKFSLALSEVTADRFRGTWSWDVQFYDSGRTERGTFVAYRSGYGIDLSVVWDELAKTIRRYSDSRTLVAAPVWTFRKVSNRLLLWDEVPF